MGKSRTLNLGTGTFVLLGFAALFFLTTQTTSRGLPFMSPPHYELMAKFDNMGDLKVGSPVSMSGVEIGRVTKIDFDSNRIQSGGCRCASTRSTTRSPPTAMPAFILKACWEESSSD